MNDFEQNGAASAQANGTSIDTRFQGVETVEAPPPTGDYNARVVGAPEIKKGKEEGSKSTYLKVHQEITSGKAKGRHVFNNLLITYKDGTIVGSPQARAAGMSFGNVALALCQAAGINAAVLLDKVGSPLPELAGFAFRGKYGTEKDLSGEKQLKLNKVLGPPKDETGEAAVAQQSGGAPTESFAS